MRIGNGDRVQVDHIGVVSLSLSIGHFLKLKNTVYMPLIGRNLIFVIALYHDGYTCLFGNGDFKLIYNSFTIGTIFLITILYKVNLNLKFKNSINTIIRKKKGSIN